MRFLRPARRPSLTPFATAASLAALLAVAAGCSDSPEGTASLGSGRPGTTVRANEPDVSTTVVPPVTGANTSETAPVLEPGVTSNNVGGPRIACKVTVTGDREATFNTYDDTAAFSSDHYLSDAELEQARNTPRSTLAGMPAPTLPAGAAPVAAWFILTCQGGDITLSITSDPRSTDSDVPFGAASYRVGDGSGGPKDLIAIVSFFRDANQLWAPEQGATLTLDRFDLSGASGAFDLPMRRRNVDGTPAGETVRFSGTFAVSCHSGSRCQQQ